MQGTQNGRDPTSTARENSRWPAIRKETVIAILGSPVAYYSSFAKVLGGVEAGIFASQFFYWYGKGHDPGGWIYKTQGEIEEETGLTRRNQETARRRLREPGVLEEKYTGMPAKLYYRLNLERLFQIMNDWFLASEEEAMDPADEGDDDFGLPAEPPAQDARNVHPRMRETYIQGCTDPPSKDARNVHPSMRETYIQACANPPSMDGGSRHTNTKNTTKTTTEITTETTTTTGPPAAAPPSPVDVTVVVSDTDVPEWILEEFATLLGPSRTANDADLAALAALSLYPDHVIAQAFDAARQWLRKPGKQPIHSLARWLAGTAKHKLEAEQSRGNTVTAAAFETAWYSGQSFIAPAVEDGQPPGGEDGPVNPEDRLWSTVLQELALQLPPDAYDRWVRDTQLLSAAQDEYVIGLANPQAKDWIQNRLANMLRRMLGSMVGYPVSVRFQVL